MACWPLCPDWSGGFGCLDWSGGLGYPDWSGGFGCPDWSCGFGCPDWSGGFEGWFVPTQLGLLTLGLFYYYASNTNIYFHIACVFLQHIIIYKHYATLLFRYHDACDCTVYAMKSSQAQV